MLSGEEFYNLRLQIDKLFKDEKITYPEYQQQLARLYYHWRELHNLQHHLKIFECELIKWACSGE